MNGELLNTFLNTLIIALVPVLVGGLGFVGNAVMNYLKARTTKEQFALLQELAVQAVRAVEQTAKSEVGKAKLEQARVIVRAQLITKGIVLDEEAITASIEAAVYQEFGKVVDL
jgi:LL-H family phage holin